MEVNWEIRDRRDKGKRIKYLEKVMEEIERARRAAEKNTQELDRMSLEGGNHLPLLSLSNCKHFAEDFCIRMQLHVTAKSTKEKGEGRLQETATPF